MDGLESTQAVWRVVLIAISSGEDLQEICAEYCRLIWELSGSGGRNSWAMAEFEYLWRSFALSEVPKRLLDFVLMHGFARKLQARAESLGWKSLVSITDEP
jgi:hypothetical protein